MYEKELVQQCRIILDEAEKAEERGDSENFAVHISNLHAHLTDQLAGKMPTESSEAEPEQPATEPAVEPVAEPAAEPKQQNEKAKSDSAACRKAGKSPY